jgi:hypothetical protein
MAVVQVKTTFMNLLLPVDKLFAGHVDGSGEAVAHALQHIPHHFPVHIQPITDRTKRGGGSTRSPTHSSPFPCREFNQSEVEQQIQKKHQNIFLATSNSYFTPYDLTPHGGSTNHIFSGKKLKSLQIKNHMQKVFSSGLKPQIKCIK